MPACELELLLAVERRDRDRRAERGLRDRDADGRVDVVALPDEPLVGPDPHLDVRVAGVLADDAGMAFAAETDPLAVVDSGRDLDRERSLLDHAAGASTLAARRLDPLAGAGAVGARLRADELAEDTSRHLLEPPGAAAGRARRDLGARLGAAPAAVRAGDRDLERDVARDAARRVDEVDLDGGREVGSPPAARPAAEEDVVPEEGGEEIGEVPEVDVPGLEAAAAKAGVAVAVVQRARLALRRAPRTPRRPP